jgi:hypothetical protein
MRAAAGDASALGAPPDGSFRDGANQDPEKQQSKTPPIAANGVRDDRPQDIRRDHRHQTNNPGTPAEMVFEGSRRAIATPIHGVFTSPLTSFALRAYPRRLAAPQSLEHEQGGTDDTADLKAKADQPADTPRSVGRWCT